MNLFQLAVPLLALSLASGCSQAKEPQAAPKAATPAQAAPAPQTKRTLPPPQNPAEQAYREGHDAVTQALAGSDDKKRWSYVVLESDANEQEGDTVSMPVVSAAKFEMRLQPKDGTIVFTKPGMKQVFKLSNPAGSKGDICPAYNVRVIDGSANHAVIRKVCLPFEYGRKRVYMSNEFFLYDAPTATLRMVWGAAADETNPTLPKADPPIQVKVTPTGYRFDWTGTQTGEAGPVKLNVRNVYTREKSGKHAGTLTCSDQNFPGKEGFENENCALMTLTPVEKTPK